MEEEGYPAMKTLELKEKQVCSDCWEGASTPGRGDRLYKGSEKAWYPPQASQKWSSFASHLLGMGRSASMGGQFPGLGTEPAVEGCVETSWDCFGLRSRIP